MRIVDVCAFYTPHGGGVRTYVHRKLAATAAMGHELIVVVPGADHSLIRVAGGHIATIPSPRLPLDRRYRYFADEAVLHATLDAWRPDVIEASSPWSSAGMVARWRGSATRALVMHCDPLSAYAYRWFGGIASVAAIDRGFDRFWRHLRSLDRSMDVVVSASGELSRRLRAGGLSKVMTLPMGVEPGLFSSKRRDDGLRAELLRRCGLPPSATLLVGVGRYSPEKRWPMVIDAVVAAGATAPVGLVLLGDGRNRGTIEARAAGSPHILVGPALRDRGLLASIMASADALVHGCEAETFCMVGAEAAASGLPVIAPDRGGASDHVQPRLGRHYKAGDAASLRAAIEDLIRARSGSSPIGPRSVRTMDEHFTELFDVYAGCAVPRLRAA